MQPGLRIDFLTQGSTAPGSVVFNEFAPRARNLSLLLATAGAKFNPVGDLLLSASVLFPVTSAGLKARMTAVLGVDFAF